MAYAKINTDLLSSIIVGRVEPNIYAFKTQTIPNYLKIGDTYRPLSVRLDEWKRVFPNLEHIYTHTARIDDETIFRDLSIHKFLENEKHLHRLRREDIQLPVFSNEFFEGATTNDIDEAIADIQQSARDKDGRYTLYSSDHLPKVFTYTRGKSFEPRENQREVINNFKTAYKLGRKNLLMFAVMRFGKSFTSMCCAKEMGADLVLVVSAKADVKEEWKKTVESIGNFDGYIFADKSNLSSSESFLRNARKEGNKVVLFLTLQDLQGDDMKDVHREVFALTWDLLLIDETHFGARAEHYGKLLLTKKEASAEMERQMNDVDTLDKLDNVIKELHTRVTIHLSGTPYRILMGSEFEKEDIIAFVQFSDIANAQKQWIEEHQFDEETPEWKNPYFGFPQMIRFAFTPNKSSLKRLAMLREKGATTSFSELFRPQSLSAKKPGFNKFVHEDVVLDFLKVIDGTKNDTNVLGFLDNERIKKGKLCRHIVIVLPYCASCDAMEKLIKSHSGVFRNLSGYEILNISGVNRRNCLKDTSAIKQQIAKCEVEGKRTITLTVNRMLTGNTVPQWDTMLFLKQSSSPEEYDQAIFRLQNPYIDEYEDNGTVIKFNMKPQTILVDFDPERIFRLQERKSQIYNVNTENNGNSKLRERIETELRISPIITLDHNKLREVNATDVLDAVRNYAKTRSVLEEASDVPIDLSLLNNPELRQVITSLNEIDSKKGFTTPAYTRPEDKEGDPVDPTTASDPAPVNNKPTPKTDETSSDNSIAKKFASYYALILFFAFLTEDKVTSLEEIIKVIGSSDNNIRLSKNLGLSANILNIIQSNSNGFALCKLDYKIQNTNSLNHDDNRDPLERVTVALTKFGRMSESEIVTPIPVADEMVGLLPDTVFSHGPILDIASKQGEFTLALIRRFGYSVSDKIYSVCTSALAYEFTRKVYRMLSLPTDHIFDSFTSYDLIKKDKDNKFVIPKEITDMNFASVIGNPPYHETKIGTSDEPIYHHFIDVSSHIVDSFTLITPARFLFNAGKTPKEWNNRMLNNGHIRVQMYKQSSTDVFPNVDLKGGVAVIGYNKNVNYPPIIHYTTSENLKTILNKVISQPDFEAIDSIIFPQNKFNLETLYEDYPQMREKIGSNGIERRLTTSIFMFYDIFTEHKTAESYKILGLVSNKRTYRYIQKKYISGNSNIGSYKVIVPKSNGKGVIGEVLSTPIIGEPMLGITQSFITFGAFSNRCEAEACLKYIRSRFVRTLLGILKVTQDNSKDTWRFVPMQDFTVGSDIDWGKSVAEIDAQLYAKYGLSDDEIAFIESMIKPM